MTIAKRKVRRCVICGSTRRVESNHVGGRHLIGWFRSPLCGEHHARFHVLLRQAGVDFGFTPDTIERARRALAAVKVFEWMLLEHLKNENERRKSKERTK